REPVRAITHKWIVGVRFFQSLMDKPNPFRQKCRASERVDPLIQSRYLGQERKRRQSASNQSNNYNRDENANATEQDLICWHKEHSIGSLFCRAESRCRTASSRLMGSLRARWLKQRRL